MSPALQRLDVAARRGLAHISGFIAGAQRTFFAPARIVAERRSSPRPMAARAMASAVAGATRTRSAQRARATCSTRPARSHQVSSVWIPSPGGDGERLFGDKAEGRLGGDDPHLVAGFPEAPDHPRRLVRRYAARYPDEYFRHAASIVKRRTPRATQEITKSAGTPQGPGQQ